MLECLPLLRSFLFGKRFATSLLATSRAPPRASERLTRLAWMHAAPEDRRWFWMIFARDPQSAHDRKPVADSKMGSSSNWAIVEISAENCVAPHLFALHACRTLQHFVGDSVNEDFFFSPVESEGKFIHVLILSFTSSACAVHYIETSCSVDYAKTANHDGSQTA